MSRHIPVDHAQVAAGLRAQPGVWHIVGEYRNVQSADNTATQIRSGARGIGRAYHPAGSFESRKTLTPDGTLVEARYIDHPAARPRRIRMSPDTERVLGQIARGEVQAGPEGARRIAAKHQADYGDAVWGPNPDTAWNDAITALSGGNTR